MAWYIIVCLVVFFALVISSIVDDWRSRCSFGFIVAVSISGFIGILCIVAFTYASVNRALGNWLWLLIAFAVIVEAWSIVSDYRKMSVEKDSSRTEALVATLVAVLLMLPAYVLGVFAAARLGS